jgi:acetyl esterase/lipase
MSSNRIYDPDIEEQACVFPYFDFADAEGTRTVLKELNAAAAADGVVRSTDERIVETERKISGPDGEYEIPIRIYMPKDRTGPGAAFINFHGGGFVTGDLESEHDRCLIMAAEGGAVAIGVDYRLAPEHPFPAGVEDCYAALEWAVANASELQIDPSRIVLGGSSAGGNLAAAVALLARDRNGPRIALQMLIYPVIDDRCDTPSMVCDNDTYIWTRQNSLDMWDHYIGKDRTNISAYAAPARAEDLSRLPPAYVITCEHDPLRDEAILYAMRLLDAGVPVELHNYPGTVHSFDFLIASEISTRAVKEAVNAFTRAVGN